MWQLRRLYIGTSLVLVKVEEEDLELTALFTQSKTPSVILLRAPSEHRKIETHVQYHTIQHTGYLQVLPQKALDDD